MFKFKKVASVLASSVMMCSTVALAAAANYPMPYSQGETAIVYGAAGANTDLVALADITADLSSSGIIDDGDNDATVSGGDAFPLFSSGKNKIYLNDTLNARRQTVTETDLQDVLADASFDGDQSAKLTHSIKVGDFPRFVYSKQPSSDDDPAFNLEMSTSPTNYLYNATVDFDKTVNFTHADSEGENIRLFGQDFTIGSATDNTNLILFKSSQKAFLNSESAPSAEVIVNEKTYTVELIAASDSSATIKLTDDAGNTDQKEINEAASKKILGVEVGVNTADENNFRLTAEVIVGAEKVKMSNGNEVRLGSDEKTVDGTKVVFSNAALGAGTTQIVIQIAAQDSDLDAILSGDSFVDPVFGTIKVNLAQVANDDSRESIEVQNSGNDKMTVKFVDAKSNEKSVNWVYNSTTVGHLDAVSVAVPVLADSNGDAIYNREMAQVNKSQYLIIGNEDEARFLEVSTITNSSGDYSGDSVSLKDVMSGDTYDVTITAEGTGTVTVGGNSYNVNYFASPNTLDSAARYIRINDPGSSGNDVRIFPTIETSNGAKLAFYQPTKIALNNWDGSSNNVTSLSFPDGDGFTSITVGRNITTDAGVWNFTFSGGSLQQVNTTIAARSASGSIGRLTYNITGSGTAGTAYMYLVQPGGGNIATPAIVVFEEQDDNDNYEAMVVRLEGVGTDADGLGVASNGIDRTSWNSGGFGYPSSTSYTTHETDTDMSSAVTLWGSVITLDSSESDQRTAKVSYPDDQVYAELYIAEESAAISGGSGGSGGNANVVPVADTEVASVSGKNLIVIGGSCVNRVAAELLGSTYPSCGADFTTKTGVASGQYLIETFSRSGGKVATLVAGYNAGDTTNAAKYLTTKTVDTTIGKKYVGTSATEATLQTTAA